jgi:[ribosomal protein S18]-alanine N-acetyltransferase
MTTTIRRMRWWDIEAVLPTEQALFPDDPWSIRTFWSELAGVPETRYYIVAEDGGDIVGYAGLATAADRGDVQTVAVRQDRQGSGLGRRLLEALLDDARQRRVREVFLEVRADNVAAQTLYERAGFTAVNRRRGYYQPSGTDAVVMRMRP